MAIPVQFASLYDRQANVHTHSTFEEKKATAASNKQKERKTKFVTKNFVLLKKIAF